MIPGRAEILTSIEAAFRLARGDASAIERFDLSVDGFFKSFWVIPLAAPFYALLLATGRDGPSVPSSWPALLAGEMVGYLAPWLVTPLVAALVTWFLGLGARYVHLIVANNWFALLLYGLMAGIALLDTVLPASLASVLMLSVTLLALAIQWFIIRVALRCTNAAAAAMLLIDLLVSTILARALDQLFAIPS